MSPSSRGDAAVVEREVIEVIERPGAERAARPVRGQLFAVRRKLRHLAVRRIDDERRIPEGTGTEFVAQEGLIRDSRGGGVVGHAFVELLGRQRQSVGLLRRPIHRHTAEVVGVPDALEARLPPGCSGRTPALVDISGGGRLGRDRAHRCRWRRRLRKGRRRGKSGAQEHERKLGSARKGHADLPLVKNSVSDSIRLSAHDTHDAREHGCLLTIIDR
jgi:hypothetical protein